VKYSPGGGVVQCFLGSNPDEAVLSVWDTGLGIAQSDIPRLFERFGRLVTRENSHIPGTGLGLYLSRELARLHGGDITVRSTLGAGSVFTLTLPLDHSAAPTVRVTRATQHAL
jgi:signal transduction histidine kinase